MCDVLWNKDYDLYIHDMDQQCKQYMLDLKQNLINRKLSNNLPISDVITTIVRNFYREEYRKRKRTMI